MDQILKLFLKTSLISGVDGIDAKQKMLMKKGKVAVKAKAKMHKASVAIKRMRRR